jgi:hypothetical protein
MEAEWWEGLIRFLDGYWWVFLIVLVLALVAYFTRNYWLPLLFL